MFQDHFSKHSSDYSHSRPSYPKELFDLLARQVYQRKQAWDCATGNGQAAISLVKYFNNVIATDASAEQITHAFKHPRIAYHVANAESSGLDDQSVDLITVAQALHWFDHEVFFRECYRVLNANGIFATWWYQSLRFNQHSQQANELLLTFYRDIIGPYWPKEMEHIDTNYQQITFPFAQINNHEIELKLNWTVAQLLNLINTWSGVKKYQDAYGQNPVTHWLAPRLLKLFCTYKAPCPLTIPLSLKICRQ